MTELTQSVRIEADLEKVFAYVSDYRNWSRFYKGIQDVKPVTEETSASGSKFIYKIKITGMTFTVGTEFRDFKKNQGWTGISFKGVKHKTKWIFEPSGGVTNFTHGVAYSLPWYQGGRLFDSLVMKAAWEKAIRSSLQLLKSNLEE